MTFGQWFAQQDELTKMQVLVNFVRGFNEYEQTFGRARIHDLWRAKLAEEL